MTAVDLFSLLFFEWSIQAGLTGLLLAGVALLVRRRNAALAHALVALALVKFAVPPIFALPTGIFSELAVRFQVEAPTGGTSSTMQFLAVIYCVGVAVATIRFVRELWKLRRVSSGAARASARSESALASLTAELDLRFAPSLRVSSIVPVPCTFGVLNPVILMPRILEERLTDDELRAVLMHELGHVRHHDAMWNVLSTLLGIVWWFHPVFHVVDRFSRALREDRCDEEVINLGVQPQEYARVIVTVAAFQSGRASVLASGASGGHPLVRRIGNIARIERVGPPRVRWLGWGLLLSAALFLLPGVRTESTSTPDRVLFVHGANHQYDHGH